MSDPAARLNATLAKRGRSWGAVAALGFAALIAARLTGVSFVDVSSGVAPSPAYAMAPLPTGLDSLTSFVDAASRIADCAGDCPGIVYFWTRRMPLSRAGIVEVAAAARELGMPLTLVGTEDLHAYASAEPGLDAPGIRIADAILRAGALAHAPALIVHDGGRVLGHAILGYKTAETYRGMIRRRVSATATGDRDPVSPSSLVAPAAPFEGGRSLSEGNRSIAEDGRSFLEGARPLMDYDALGNPGAYFRWVPGRQAVAYESGARIYLLDLVDGRSRPAPGYVDFVPTPDGRYFVTPGRGRDGLSFYDADRVFEAARAEARGSVVPFFMDAQMRDQYPSVGILEQEPSRTVYRVLTSWFEGIVYRDYEVRVNPRTGLPGVRPVGEPLTPCAGAALSTPIMSQDGLEVAVRDETTGTTKIFRIREGGGCTEVLDLGVATSKVAWHRTGRLLAFARPPERRRGLGGNESTSGIFLYDRDQRRLTRLSDSESASSLAFPDFIGDDSVVFLIPRRSGTESSVFRVVDDIR